MPEGQDHRPFGAFRTPLVSVSGGGESDEPELRYPRARRTDEDAVQWEPSYRVNCRMDAALIARLDNYCKHANRSRSAAARHLIAVGLRHFEEAMDAQDSRSS